MLVRKSMIIVLFLYRICHIINVYFFTVFVVLYSFISLPFLSYYTCLFFYRSCRINVYFFTVFVVLYMFIFLYCITRVGTVNILWHEYRDHIYLHLDHIPPAVLAERLPVFFVAPFIYI